MAKICITFKTSILLFLTIGLLSPATYGQSPDDISYPELQVTPRASKRLFLEAKKERKGEHPWYSYNLPIQTSSLLTFLAGVSLSGNQPTYSGISSQTERDKKLTASSQAATFGMMVGAIWLGYTAYMQTTYSPYQDAHKELVKMSTKNKRDELTKERLSEERLSEPAKIHRNMAYFSAISNLAVSAFMIDNSEGDPRVLAAFAAGVSILPLIFDSHWEKVYKKHQEYKKKIYGPVAYTFLIQDPDQTLHPGMGLKMNF